jgi:hypothetical protein
MAESFCRLGEYVYICRSLFQVMAEKQFTSGEEQPRKSGCRTALKAVGISLVAMVVIVIGLIVGVTSWLDKYTHHDESVRVPVVAGMSAEEAEQALREAGLEPRVVDSVYSEARPGEVIEQLPEGNLPVKLGRIVYLTINARSRRMVRMPDLHEWSSRQAKSRLVEAGFVVDSVKLEPYEYDDLVLRVTAGGVAVEAGQSYPYRMHVVLHVGSTRVTDEEDGSLDDDDEVGFSTDAEDEAAAADFLME